MVTCLLCNTSNTDLFYHYKDRKFYHCKTCGSVFISRAELPSKVAEKERYLAHQNNIADSGFQKFVSPIVTAVQQNQTKEQTGLDFGAGTGPVISKLLGDSGYTMTLYDPFFHPDTSVLDANYNFIVCCEVIEHLHQPLQEFKLLKRILKETGVLYCMTDLLPEKEAFKTWYYKNDFTHVIFYTPQSLEWIREKVGFKNLTIEKRLIRFS
jgi:hypothetical protein